MKDFKQLKINREQSGLIGNRIEIHEIFNEPIIVHRFKIVPSKWPKEGCDRCLHLQIEINGAMRVLFTTSEVMMRDLEQMDEKEDFPFTTTIKKVNRRFEFS